MSENESDPAGTTQQFRAFSQGGGGEQPAPRVNVGLLAGVAVAVLVAAVVVVLLLS